MTQRLLRMPRRASGHQVVVCAVLAISMAALPVGLVADDNTSSKPVGFVRMAVAPTNDLMASIPFHAFNPGINSIFTNQLTGATNESSADAILRWDTNTQDYTYAFKADLTGDPGKDGLWFADFTTWTMSGFEFSPGQGFWIRNRLSSTQTVFLCGEVVLDSAALISFPHGPSAFGYPFSSVIGLNDATLASDGAYGTSPITNSDAITDEATLQDFWLRTNDNKWVDAGENLSDLKFTPGRGFWYDRVPESGFAWQPARPYSDLYPTNELPPVVTAMTVNSNKDEMTLTIQTTGNSGEKLDIYYKDLAATNAFTSTGWQIAATNIPTYSEQTIMWTDSGSATRGKINTVYSRYYLIGRADLDSDQDGIPDARETFVLGTLPGDADSDNDGMADGRELFWGFCPTVSNGFIRIDAASGTNTWHTGFEPSEGYTTNALNGQNGWVASNGVLVVDTTSHTGTQSVLVPSAIALEDAPQTMTANIGASGRDIVWVGFYAKLPQGLPQGDMITNASSSVNFCMSSNHVQAYDGLDNEWKTSAQAFPEASNAWARLDVRMDFSDKEYLVCVNGRLALDAVHFADLSLASLSSVEIFGSRGISSTNTFVDDMYISTDEPAAALDYDGDGLSNAGEYQNNTDPLDSDSDNDGLPDGWEVDNDTDPLVSDSGLDPDGDGLTNLQEYQYGSAANSTDTDADGGSDYTEVQWGRNPASADSYPIVPVAINFETGEGYTAGSLNGQQGWSVLTGTAQVQTSVVFSNAQAVSVSAGTNPVTSIGLILDSVTNTVLWTDYYLKPAVGNLPAILPARATAVYAASSNGYWAARSGTGWLLATNKAAASTGQWTHIAIKENYTTRTWDFYVGEDLVFANLSFADTNRSSPEYFAFYDTSASTVYLDCLNIGANPPGHVDMDGDGLNNDEETAQGTDPLVADSDNDGMSDGRELFWGFSPTTSNSFIRIDAASGTNSWNTGFEPSEGYTTNALNGQQGWIASNEVAVVDSISHTGTQSVIVPGVSTFGGAGQGMYANVGASERSIVWVGFYTILPQGAPQGAMVTNSSSAVNVCMFGNRLYAYDGLDNEWKTSAQVFPEASNAWARLDVRMDFASRQYRVYVNCVLAVDGVNFADQSLSSLSSVEFLGSRGSSSTNTLVDDMYISTDEPFGPMDFDGDGLTNAQEAEYGTDPYDADTDNDGMPDKWEVDNGTNPLLNDASLDPDGDGLTNLQECAHGTDPFDADADGDGLNDWYEVHVSQSDPNLFSTAGDGLSDRWKDYYGLNPQTYMNPSADADGDGLTNQQEYQGWTDPNVADTDGDGLNDASDSNPLVADQGSDPDGPTLEVTSPTEGELILW